MLSGVGAGQLGAASCGGVDVPGARRRFRATAGGIPHLKLSPPSVLAPCWVHSEVARYAQKRIRAASCGRAAQRAYQRECGRALPTGEYGTTDATGERGDAPAARAFLHHRG